MEENNQNGQLNNNQGTTTSGQGANFSTQNIGGNIVGNDTAGTGSGAVVSLKGGQTQKEIDEQKRIEELKSRAVKLERKLTPREKELEKLHKQAVKPVSPVGKFQGTSYNQDTKNKVHNTNNVQNTRHNNQKNRDTVNSGINYKKQEELVENLINPTESLGKPQNTENPIQETSQQKTSINYKRQDANYKAQTNYKKQDIKSKIRPEKKQEEKSVSTEILKEKQVKKVVEQKPAKRMVISPAGQISYVDNQELEGSVIKKEEQVNVEKDAIKKSSAKAVSSSNIVNLKSEEESLTKQQAESRVVKSEGVVKTLEAPGTARASKTLKTPGVSEASEIPWEERRVDLKELSTEKRIDMQATPSLASVRLKMDEDLNGELAEWFDKYNKLPINIKLGLGSEEVRQKIKEFAKQFGSMNEEFLGEVSRIVREVYTDLIKTEDIRRRLMQILKIQQEKVDQSIENIAEVVTLIKDIGNKKSEEYFERLSLKEALQKYKNIAEEEVTVGNINDKKTGEYVRPTVQNWLDDYINRAGSNIHTSLERGKYLDDSLNTKNLEIDEKMKVDKLIKSYDIGSKLIIDRDEKNILWNLHDDESKLGINSNRKKRVINKFKIEEAQKADVDEDVRSNFEKEQKEGIIKKESESFVRNAEEGMDLSISDGKKKDGVKAGEIVKEKENNSGEDNLLNLSSEIDALRG
jgi:hypothetical protein